MELKLVNSLFISDVHLGWRYSCPKRLAAFLSQYQSNYLYIVGDFFDFFGFPRSWVWNDGMFDVFAEIIRLKESGCKVVYVIGNHDEAILENKFVLPGIEIVKEAVHITNDYVPILITHGHIFDNILALRIHPAMYRWGDRFYYWAIWWNGKINWIRKLFGFKYWSLSAHLKHNVKNAINYLGDFENVVSDYCLKKNFQAVVTGHIHIPAAKVLASGVTYYNCGAWILGEGESALVENLDGKIELYRKDEQ